MTAPKDKLKRRVYNVTAMSFTPEELVDKLSKYVPELRVTYNPDSRQEIGSFLIEIIEARKTEIKKLNFFCQPIPGHKSSMTQKLEQIGTGNQSMI